jgi:transposase-like protein
MRLYRNVFLVTPGKKVKEVATMLKAIYAREDKVVTLKKIDEVLERYETA